MNLGTKERCGCVSVKEDLLPSEGFASHPITLGRTKRKQESRGGSEAHPPLSCRVSQFTLSACWQLAIQIGVSPLSLPLRFPVARTRGNGPFYTIYGNKLKAAISPLENY